VQRLADGTGDTTSDQLQNFYIDTCHYTAITGNVVPTPDRRKSNLRGYLETEYWGPGQLRRHCAARAPYFCHPPSLLQPHSRRPGATPGRRCTGSNIPRIKHRSGTDRFSLSTAHAMPTSPLPQWLEYNEFELAMSHSRHQNSRLTRHAPPELRKKCRRRAPDPPRSDVIPRPDFKD